MYKKIVAISLMFSGISLYAQENGAQIAERPQKFAVVQPNKIFLEGDGGSLEWKERTEMLRADVMERGQKIQADIQRFQQLKMELESANQGKTKWSTPESREEKIREAAVLERGIEVAYKAASEYEMQKAQEIQNDLIKKLERVVADIAKEQQFDVVFAGGVVYASPAVDITPLVVERLNKEYQVKRKAEAAKKKSNAEKKAVTAA